ncbi:MAG: WD40/YVTN/BNR-like repeat-containing protein, partial [Actinomycetota bacterium]
LAASRDAGATWDFVDRGLHAAYARAVALLDGSVFLSVSEGPGGRRSAVYRAALTLDEPFVRCTDGLPEWFGTNVDTGCLVAAGGMVALGTDGGSRYASADGGGRWDVVAGDLPPITCLAAAG